MWHDAVSGLVIQEGIVRRLIALHTFMITQIIQCTKRLGEVECKSKGVVVTFKQLIIISIMFENGSPCVPLVMIERNYNLTQLWAALRDDLHTQPFRNPLHAIIVWLLPKPSVALNLFNPLTWLHKLAIPYYNPVYITIQKGLFTKTNNLFFSPTLILC